jgi:hypothetical protein
LKNFTRAVLAIGLTVATLGNCLLATSCASDPRARRYEAANYAVNLGDAATTIIALRKPGVHESNVLLAPIAHKPALLVAVKLAAATFENKMCERDLKAGRNWQLCYALPIAINGIITGLNLRFVF